MSKPFYQLMSKCFHIREFGAEVLTTKATQWIDGFDAVLHEIVEAMFAKCEEAGGIGLAAPQVGLSKRIAVINLTANAKNVKVAIINPEIMIETGEQDEWEGCLSIPNFKLKVKRPLVVHLNYQNIYGVADTMVGIGLAARAIRHEVDHLDGKLIMSQTEIPDSVFLTQ